VVGGWAGEYDAKKNQIANVKSFEECNYSSTQTIEEKNSSKSSASIQPACEGQCARTDGTVDLTHAIAVPIDYNWLTTVQTVICQFYKNPCSISLSLSMSY